MHFVCQKHSSSSILLYLLHNCITRRGRFDKFLQPCEFHHIPNAFILLLVQQSIDNIYINDSKLMLSSSVTTCSLIRRQASSSIIIVSCMKKEMYAVSTFIFSVRRQATPIPFQT